MELTTEVVAAAEDKPLQDWVEVEVQEPGDSLLLAEMHLRIQDLVEVEVVQEVQEVRESLYFLIHILQAYLLHLDLFW